MQDSITQQHPLFLMPWESSTYILQNNSVTIEEFPSNEIPEINSPAVVELDGGDTYEKTVLQNADFTSKSSNTIEDDFMLSECESDPFATSDDSNDMDYIPTLRKNSTHSRDPDDIENSSEHDDKNEPMKTKKHTRKRQRNPGAWRRNKIKKLRNLGVKYIDWRGNLRPKR
ncbi:unnamed protein product [Acanthoscelides obtectus]|uniref:Uncharacterized protein n=1 Tax=Acanthoscelides obtectus TaxID=200917 RepID=A0A9P0L4I0_ACAOB|nr:unnamed protein product [Acanthoscelides obtectus]CAK1620419.1 hypothetical protein AOBTE_LOCUS367 [Acanthoscelides obtectus]